MTTRTATESSLVVSYLVMPADTNPAGNVHGGVIMKHIDNTAGIVAYRHARANVVTASIDRLDFHNPAFVGELLTLKACLNYVGRSSMEIGVRVEAENLLSGEVRHIASAYLTFVSLDEKHRPKEVPQLLFQTEGECRRNREAIERNKMRKLEKQKEKKALGDCLPSDGVARSESSKS
ncbi:MAG: acyl-CoA thioesterase [Desulfobacteraceae bacterium]|nr:acyl-CoA thioesterase [Desulfobacteraceae bacterium]